VVFHTTAPVLRTCPLSEGRQWGVWLLASASWDYYYAAWGRALGGTAVRAEEDSRCDELARRLGVWELSPTASR
jgi:hypothetical protein